MVRLEVEAVPVTYAFPLAEMFVVEALARVAVPVRVGDAEKTTEPVPVSSERRDERSAEVAIEVEESLVEKEDQSAEVRSPLLVAEEDGMLKVSVLPEPLMVKSVPVVEVASVAVPEVTVCPVGPTAVSVE